MPWAPGLSGRHAAGGSAGLSIGPTPLLTWAGLGLSSAFLPYQLWGPEQCMQSPFVSAVATQSLQYPVLFWVVVITSGLALSSDVLRAVLCLA